MGTEDNLPVSSDDELTGANPDAHRALHVRRLGEFKPSNMPLSAAELEHRRNVPGHQQPADWTPRTLENVRQVNPLEEEEPASS